MFDFEAFCCCLPRSDTKAGLFLKEDHRPLLLPPLGHWESQNLSPRDVAFSPADWKKTPPKQDLVSFSNARVWKSQGREDVAWCGFGDHQRRRGLLGSRFYSSFATHTHPQNNLQRKNHRSAGQHRGASPASHRSPSNSSLSCLFKRSVVLPWGAEGGLGEAILSSQTIRQPLAAPDPDSGRPGVL